MVIIEALERFQGVEVAGFIQKPFGLGALVDLVLRLLPPAGVD